MENGFINGFKPCSAYELRRNYPNYKLINLDLMTYASDASYLKTLKDNPNYVFVKGDIRDEKLVNKLFDEHKIDSVIHLCSNHT